MSLNQERRGSGLPSTSHSIRRDSVTFTVWLVRLRLYRGASSAARREREREEIKHGKESRKKERKKKKIKVMTFLL